MTKKESQVLTVIIYSLILSAFIGLGYIGLVKDTEEIKVSVEHGLQECLVSNGETTEVLWQKTCQKINIKSNKGQ